MSKKRKKQEQEPAPPAPVETEAEQAPDELRYRCWCGAVGTYEDLCDFSGLDTTCGGSGTLDCYCGGDLCVCHHHGSIECDGCEDCKEDPGDWDDGWDGDWDDYED